MSTGVLDIEHVKQKALVCRACPLSEGRTQVVWADGNLDADLLFIGEAPGYHEDQQGIPFVGAAGQLLDRLLAEIGLDRTRAAIVNVLKCRPPNNRDPQPSEIEACKPFLEAQVRHMKPKVIVTLGNFATRFMLGQPIGITKARGRRYTIEGMTVIPTFHPAAALRGGRFGGMSPVDAIRADLQIVKEMLAEGAEGTDVSPGEPDEPDEPDDSEQLGLF